MLLDIFNWLYKLTDSGNTVAIIAALIWGMLSIILSPCHLASIPLIVGFINEQDKLTTKKAFLLSTFFATGILITIAVVGLLTSYLGIIIGDTGFFGNLIVAGVLVVFGLHLLGVIQLKFLTEAKQPNYKDKGLYAAFILGLVFGIALGPCTFAFMAPILSIAFKLSANHFTLAASLVLVYAIGHCSVIVLAGTFSRVVQDYLNWNERSEGTVFIKKICGVLVIVAGIYLFFRK
ncbi:MAG: cytochrome C biogenesis protein [Elusimicrobia bacterium RIFOXYD2_FULL_34_15]|nr:MAG: cytochrome C biogenesis protein [Elusimicrobia bacterium RIFOXYD2_FULL_34_15]